jgi:formiminoglutamase
MSGESSSAAPWSTRLKPPELPTLPSGPDDPRLVQYVRPWTGDLADLAPGAPALIGFPIDEGVRRNSGRPGAAAAPAAVRAWLYRLTPYDPETGADLARLGLLDLGDLADVGNLEQAQEHLGQIVAELLRRQVVPIVVGGGHETAYGHYLGHVAAGVDVAVMNVDAHLDVRPLVDGRGHSGSPFRQMLTHPNRPLPGGRYACLGAQPAAVSREHLDFVRERGGSVHWAGAVRGRLIETFEAVRERLGPRECPLYVSLDADVVRAGDVPGVSAPNPLGLCGIEVARWARHAGACASVRSFDLVEINPRFDVDDRSARWAAEVLWHFLAGLARRSRNDAVGW